MLVTVKELANILKVKPDTIRRWMREGTWKDAPVIRVHRTIRFDLDKIMEYLNARNRQG